MPQNRIPRGGHGAILVTEDANGRWVARTLVRDLDGRRRAVRVAAKTKGAATRMLEQRLDERTDRTLAGVTPDMTFETLANLWLEHRRDHGKARSEGLLAPQTLAIYDSEIQQVIIPAIGEVRVGEASVPFLDRLFADVENGRDHGAYQGRPGGRSTKQLRVVLGGMLGMAVSHGALRSNPMRDAASTSREKRREVEFLTVEQANHLRLRVVRSSVRVDGERPPNRDLEELVELLLGTGMREGEALAIRPIDLVDLDGDKPLVIVRGTLVEPRKGYVEQLHRQDTTKSREDRTLVLPDRVAAMLRERMDREPPRTPESPVFGSAKGTWLWPANLRTRLRTAIERAQEHGTDLDRALQGTTFHTLRRTVGTLLAHEVSLDAAREQLGHRDQSVTFRHYVGKRAVAPDNRETLNQLLEPLPAERPVDAVLAQQDERLPSRSPRRRPALAAPNAAPEPARPAPVLFVRPSAPRL